MKRNLGIILLSLLLVVSLLGACTGNKEGEQAESTEEATEAVVEEEVPEPEEAPEPIREVTVRVAGMKGPTGIGMAHLLEQAENGETQNNYDIVLEGTPDLITGNVINGSLDIAALPVNVISVLNNKTEGEVQILGVNALGVVYILTDDDTINTLEDLRGKTIHATGQGSTPEYTFRHILSAHGIDPDQDLELIFEDEASALQAKTVAGEVSIALLPEPFVSTVLAKNEDFRIVFDITQEWEQVTEGAPLTTGGVLVRKAFLEEHPEAVEIFMEEYGESCRLANEDLEKTAELAVTYGIIPSQEIALSAIPRSNITFLAGEEMKAAVSEYLEVLFASNPQSVGGALPNDEFYYIQQ